MSHHVVYLTTDLMFSAAVLSHAREQGITVHIVATVPAAIASAVEHSARLVLLDLNVRVDVAEAVAGLKQLPNPPRLVAYGSHVQETLLAAARNAGCDEVLPRSQFDRRMGAILAE